MDDDVVAAHYASAGLYDRIVAALVDAGYDLQNLTPVDLARADQFHTGGLQATRELAARTGWGSGMKILDVGGGLGGPARILAKELGCSVEVLDLTPEFVDAGRRLTDLVGLSGQVSFRLGSAFDMPYADGSFDGAWTQHSSMNMPDKPQLYRELARVLRPGGRLAIHEVIAGPVQPLRFPVPWAREPSISFLLDADHLRSTIEGAGFHLLEWTDQSEQASAWFAQTQPAGVRLPMLLGPDFPVMFGNMQPNLAEQRITIMQAVFER